MSSIRNWKIIRILFSLALLGNASAAVLHFHLEDSKLEISATEHEVECVLCELGSNTSRGLALFSRGVNLFRYTAFLVPTEYENFSAPLFRSTVSPRAPPVS